VTVCTTTLPLDRREAMTGRDPVPVVSFTFAIPPRTGTVRS
jgi:hypothetical protein